MTPHYDCALGCLKACGLLVKLDEPFLAASPDGLFSCRCCGLSVIEAKCPYSVREQKITENYSKTDSLKMRDGSVKSKKSHKLYSQLTMLMAISQARQIYFVVGQQKIYSLRRLNFQLSTGTNCIQPQLSFSEVMCCRFFWKKENCVVAQKQ